MSTAQRSERFPAEFFRREDEGDDRLFYESPRLVVHIDDHAISAIREFFGQVMPLDGMILDLMSSWRSHLPKEFKGRAVGLGLNAVEMAENPQLSDGVVHDLNADPRLPFEDESFDAAAVTVSVQYVTKPVAVFRDVNRVLKAGGAFHVIYSNRMFPTKAVAVWKAIPDEQKAELITSYFHDAGGWNTPQFADVSPRSELYCDPVYTVSATKV